MRNLYALGSTLRTGYAVPLMTGVSMKPSGTSEGFGVPGTIGIVVHERPVGSPVHSGFAIEEWASRWVYGGKNHSAKSHRPMALAPELSAGFWLGM